MTMNNPLAAVLSHIQNCERVGKTETIVRPGSKLIRNVLDILNNERMIGETEILEDKRGNSLKVYLIGKINKCGVISPRFSVRKDSFERFEKQYLPAEDFGVIIVLTSQGMMTHREAKEKGIGARLLAYCY
ncbi:MAG: 30S ribosomal protein S8 [Nanoarchaeota archaeon]